MGDQIVAIPNTYFVSSCGADRRASVLDGPLTARGTLGNKIDIWNLSILWCCVIFLYDNVIGRQGRAAAGSGALACPACFGRGRPDIELLPRPPMGGLVRTRPSGPGRGSARECHCRADEVGNAFGPLVVADGGRLSASSCGRRRNSRTLVRDCEPVPREVFVDDLAGPDSR